MIRKKSYSFIKFSIFLILLFDLCVFASSCSQNVPEVKNVSTMAIFDYANNNDFPVARLSFFVESSSDARRAETIEVYSKKYGYTWKTDRLIKIATSKRQWAGYSNFAIPESLSIPDGSFVVKYHNADGESTESNAYVSFDSNFITSKVEDVPALMADKRGKLNVAVFDKDNNLLIYGEKTKDLRTEETILRKYKNAFYYRDVWTVGNNTMICLLPITYFKK